jgi:hypothetical protein
MSKIKMNKMRNRIKVTNWPGMQWTFEWKREISFFLEYKNKRRIFRFIPKINKMCWKRMQDFGMQELEANQKYKNKQQINFFFLISHLFQNIGENPFGKYFEKLIVLIFVGFC